LASSAERFYEAGGAGVYQENGGSGEVLLHEAMLEGYLEKVEFSRERRLSGLVKAMRWPLLAGGEGRTYGLVCIEAASDLGLDAKEALPAAGAVEFVHTISMVHDALPAIGRLRPELEPYLEAVDQATAILAGDGFWGEALGLLTRAQSGSPERVLGAVRELARSTGAEGMIGGHSIGLGGERDGESPEAVYDLKWGTLFAAAAKMGASLAGGSQMELDAVSGYAWNVGICHRISLELDGSVPDGDRVFTRTLGKEAAESRAREARRAALGRLDEAGLEARGMRELLEYVSKTGRAERKEGR